MSFQLYFRWFILSFVTHLGHSGILKFENMHRVLGNCSSILKKRIEKCTLHPSVKLLSKWKSVFLKETVSIWKFMTWLTVILILSQEELTHICAIYYRILINTDTFTCAIFKKVKLYINGMAGAVGATEKWGRYAWRFPTPLSPPLMFLKPSFNLRYAKKYWMGFFVSEVWYDNYDMFLRMVESQPLKCNTYRQQTLTTTSM